mmetsp:Transcript_20502/g.41027  ORF Transcript_20502/g.41027 Transcript_20502/m.41027 type:complete len:218 (-) Transcript_20502:53-706(-)
MSLLKSLTTLPPFVYTAVTPPISAFLGMTTRLVMATSTIQEEVNCGDEILNRPAVLCLWHGHLPFLIPWLGHGALELGHTRTLLVQSNAYMGPTVRWCEDSGLRVRRGGGKDDSGALALLVEEVEAGNSVVMAVDGPSGPDRSYKVGAVEVAKRCGIPLVHVSYKTKGKKSDKRWDGRLAPRPFDRIEVKFSAPVRVTSDCNVISETDKLSALYRHL